MAMALLAAPAASQAHLMPQQQGTVNVVGPAAFVVISVPVTALSGIDDNRDARLSEGELARHRDLITAQVRTRFVIISHGEKAAGQVLQLLAEPDERFSAGSGTVSDSGAGYFLALMRYSLVTEAGALTIETDLFGLLAHQKQLTLKLSRGLETEAAILTPLRASHSFFQPAGAVLLDYVGTGLEHIVFGWDHLLFLLTLLVATRQWRHWLTLLTSFTLAHSLSLVATLLGWVNPASSWVEPGIAASIVVVAALNVTQPLYAARSRVAVVSACGLLHGLGFAGAMAQMGLHGTHTAISLIGFNLGIELGQIMFIAATAALLFAAEIALRHGAAVYPGRAQAARACTLGVSWGAMAVGTLWLFERLGAAAATA